MAFDPDLYLQREVAKGDVTAKQTGFNPDAYLKSAPTKTGFLEKTKQAYLQQNPQIAQQVANPSGVSTGQLVGRNLASVADLGVNTVQDVLQAIPYVQRRLTGQSVDQATQESKLNIPQNPVGDYFGVTQTPTYQQNLARALTEKAGEYVEPAVRKVSEVTGAPVEDIGAGLTVAGLGAPFASKALRTPVAKAPAPKPYDEVGKPLPGQLRADVLRGQELVGPPTPPPQAMASALRGNVADTDTMVGVGSATPGEAAIRTARAERLPVPIKLTKGEAGRESGQAQFEHDISRQGELGAPIRERKAVNNERLLQNFDKIIDEDYAPQFAKPETPRLVGEETRSALKENFEADRKEVRRLYDEAKIENANTRVSVNPILDFIDSKPPALLEQAPSLKIARDQIRLLNRDNSGQVPLNDLQEVYKLVNQSMKPEGADLTFGTQLKVIINDIADGAGGAKFKEAQAARRKLGQEYQNVSSVSKLIETKRGRNSADQQVATEDIVDRVVRRGSLQDLKNVENALMKSERGKAAMNEIRAQTLLDFKNAITKNIAENDRGQRVISPKALDQLVRELDADGKLEHLFGAKGAQTLRDIRDTAVDISYVPQGANVSGTTHALVRLVERIGKGGIGDPFGVMKTLGEGLNNMRIKKAVSESLNYKPEQLAKELRKSRRKETEGSYSDKDFE